MAARIQPIGLAETLGLYSLPLLPGQVEGATQVFKKSAVLVLSSGLVIEASAANPVVLGIAAAPGQNSSASPACQVVPVRPQHIFEISIDGAASGGNAPG